VASGFDIAGFGTGLIGSINANNAANAKAAREEQMEGDRQQSASFQEAVRENDAEIAKAKATNDKIDALANIISHGQPNPAAYSVARDAVDIGYTGSEHLPQVMKAYNDTMKDYMDNPDKWGNTKTQNTGDIQDTNPGQTAALRRLGNQQSIADLEKIRQGARGNVDKPYADLPGGQWSQNMEDIFKGKQGEAQATKAGDIAAETTPSAIQGEAAKTYATATASQNAAADAEKGRAQAIASSLGIGGPQAGQAPVQASMPGQQQGQAEAQGPADMGGELNSSALASPKTPYNPQSAMAAPQPQVNTDGGIHIEGPPPPETSTLPEIPAQQQPGPAQAAQTQQLGNKEGQINPITKLPIHIDPQTHLDENYLATIKDPISQNMVRQIANYDIMPPSQAMRPDSKGDPSPMFEYLMAAKGANPDFSMTNYKALVGLKAQYIDPNGVAQKQYQAIGTGLSHLGMLQQAGQALAQANIQGINTIANKVGAQIGATAPVTYQAIVQRLAPEIVSSYVAGGGDLTDRMAAEKTLNNSLSGAQREAAISATAHLLYGKLMPLQNTWDQNFPNEAGRDFLPPNAHAVLKGLGVDETDKTPYLTGQTPNQPQKDYSHIWNGQ
jgi:hypothetical protein